MTYRSLILLAMILTFAASARGEDNDKDADLMYPLTLRRPVFETLLDLTAKHEKHADGRETELAAELEYRALPWWRLSFEVPVLFNHAQNGPTIGGVSDVGLTNSFRLFKSTEHKSQIIGGLALTLPSGSKHRGLGGDTALEPFLAGGMILENFHLIADAAYRWTVDSPATGEREQVASAGLAAGYEVTEHFLPMLELKTVRLVRGENDSEGPKLLHKGQVYLTPGVNYKLTDETTLRFGVELPVSRTREFEYSIQMGLTVEF